MTYSLSQFILDPSRNDVHPSTRDSEPYMHILKSSQTLFSYHQEKDAKASLQAQIQSLREDNQRLLEESYSASAKLKKFTEWVFNTIDMN